MRLSEAMLTAGRGLLPVWLLLFTLVPLLTGAGGQSVDAG